jgi:hypothetical protein
MNSVCTDGVSESSAGGTGRTSHGVAVMTRITFRVRVADGKCQHARRQIGVGLKFGLEEVLATE